MGVASMDEAVEIKTRHENELLGLDGVTGVDVGYRRIDGNQTEEPAIRVYVADRGAAPSIPEQIEDVPVEVVERTFELH
jgi:hypothetical protein